jgi:rare lipoprotein A
VPAEPEQPFTDTLLDSWYTEYLITAKNKGLINGYEDGTFKPDQNINLVEALKIYFECIGEINYPEGEEYSYADTDSMAWYAKYTNYANSENLIEINLDNKIYPEHEISRGELAEIIYRNIVAADNNDFGKATYYGAAAHGHNTASGETFDMNAMTAAHKTLPFGTMVEVTNLANGKFVTVKITDRGPYGAGRVIDLSSGAFKLLAPLSTGVINVKYRVVQ